jgi:hypothetical protein
MNFCRGRFGYGVSIGRGGCWRADVGGRGRLPYLGDEGTDVSVSVVLFVGGLVVVAAFEAVEFQQSSICIENGEWK